MELPITTKQHQEQAAAANTSATSSTSLTASPRNTASSGSGGASFGSQINAMEVSASLQDGEKFVKWDEVCELVNILTKFFNNNQLVRNILLVLGLDIGYTCHDAGGCQRILSLLGGSKQ